MLLVSTVLYKIVLLRSNADFQIWVHVVFGVLALHLIIENSKKRCWRYLLQRSVFNGVFSLFRKFNQACKLPFPITVGRATSWKTFKKNLKRWKGLMAFLDQKRVVKKIAPDFGWLFICTVNHHRPFTTIHVDFIYC